LEAFFILDSELRTGDFEWYYVGVASLFLGVWVNGSFAYFYRKILSHIPQQQPTTNNQQL